MRVYEIRRSIVSLRWYWTTKPRRGDAVDERSLQTWETLDECHKAISELPHTERYELVYIGKEV